MDYRYMITVMKYILIHSGDINEPVITKIVPDECRAELSNWLIASGTTDEGYVFSAPYSTTGWITGTIPSGMEDFILNASITDPPLLIAKMLNKKLIEEGITISEEPSTFRSKKNFISEDFIEITETVSPPLVDIIEVINHESVNLFAEHLIKELGKTYNNEGSTAAGLAVVNNFLNKAAINNEGVFMEDGSGLSPLNAINTRALVSLLGYMKRESRYFTGYYSSLPEAGSEGTLKYYFRDDVFNSSLRAKSGSMTRVRSYSGYFTTISGKELIFSIIINNYSGSSKNIVSGIEGILKEFILYK